MTYPKLNLPRIPDADRSSARDAHSRGLTETRRPPARRTRTGDRTRRFPPLTARSDQETRLARDLLVSRHGGGTYVTDRLDASLIDPWQQLIDQHPFLQDDVLEFRYLLEGSAAELAAQRATDADLERLEQAYLRLDAALRAKTAARRWLPTSLFI
jgi:GntR family transcriptional repressor for pyruvate dehydrogenase complex